MSHELNLEDIDVDGAVRETAAEAMDALDGDTRSQFLRRAGLAGGAFMGGGALLGALAPTALGSSLNRGPDHDRPPSKFGKGDIGILNYALTLEYLESSFYNEASRELKGKISNQALVTFLRTVTDDENQHVRALKHVLGHHAVKEPKFHFNGDTSTPARFVNASVIFENTGVRAYSGQAFNIKDPAVLAAALSIVTVEARHASVVGLIQRPTLEKGIAPSGAFDKPLGAKDVLKAVHSLNYGL